MHALRVLEFDQILLRLAAACETELGARFALEIEPEFQAADVQRRLAETAAAMALLGSESLPSLGAVRDVRESCIRASKGGSVDGATLYSIGMALSLMRQLRRFLAKVEDTPLHDFALAMPELPKTEAKLLDSLDGDGEVRDTASADLARLRSQKRSAASRILEKIQSYTTGKNRDYLSDAVYTQREGRYVIPVKSEHRGKIKGLVHDTSSSGQTLYVEPEEVVQLGNMLREAEAAERAEVARILADLSSRVGTDGAQIAAGVEAVSRLDVILAKVRLGDAMQGSLPVLAKGFRISVRNARHPLIDADKVVPLTVSIGEEQDGLLITGPNTGGKTVSIKCVGLCAMMSQCGMLPPADEVRIGPFTQVWADIGDEQSLSQSLSTFSGHIKNIARAIRELKPGALVLLDEVGAGTDPAEGAALAKAILLTLQSKGARIMASTHYGELKVFAYNTPGFANAAMEFDLKSLRPTYRMLMGSPGASHALRIAERCGMPTDVIEAAKESHGVQGQEVAQMLERLETAQKLAQRAQGESDRLAAKLRQVEAETDRKLEQAEEARRTARSKAAGQLEESLREIRLQAQEIFDELKRDRSDRGMEVAREKLKKLDQKGKDSAARMRPSAPAPKPSVAKIEKGMSVKVRGYTAGGTVLEEPRDGKAIVQVGALRMTFPINQLEIDAKPEPAKAKPVSRPNLGLAKAQSTRVEIHLRNMRAEDAQQQLEKFLDDAMLASYPSVRIVHGKGEGILRKIVHDYLTRHHGVREFRLGEPAEGGDGVTIAVLA